MAEAKAMSLAHEMALLCVIFPVEPVECDSSSRFLDKSSMFRCVDVSKNVNIVFRILKRNIMCFYSVDICCCSIATLKHGQEDIPTAAFIKRQCFCARSSPLYESMTHARCLSIKRLNPFKLQVHCHSAFGLESCRRSARVI